MFIFSQVWYELHNWVSCERQGTRIRSDNNKQIFFSSISCNSCSLRCTKIFSYLTLSNAGRVKHKWNIFIVSVIAGFVSKIKFWSNNFYKSLPLSWN